MIYLKIFSDYISKECQIFIKSLLSGNLKDVIEIKNHSYFKDVNWNKVYYKILHNITNKLKKLIIFTHSSIAEKLHPLI